MNFEPTFDQALANRLALRQAIAEYGDARAMQALSEPGSKEMYLRAAEAIRLADNIALSVFPDSGCGANDGCPDCIGA